MWFNEGWAVSMAENSWSYGITTATTAQRWQALLNVSWRSFLAATAGWWISTWLPKNNGRLQNLKLPVNSQGGQLAYQICFHPEILRHGRRCPPRAPAPVLLRISSGYSNCPRAHPPAFGPRQRRHPGRGRWHPGFHGHLAVTVGNTGQQTCTAVGQGLQNNFWWDVEWCLSARKWSDNQQLCQK